MSDSNRVRGIDFCGVKLPRYAHTIDAAAFYETSRPLPEATLDWFFRFSVCVGRWRDDTSANVLHHSRKLLHRLDNESESVLGKLSECRSNDDPPALEIFAQWREALHTMMAIAGTRDHCEWIGESDPSDPGVASVVKGLISAMNEAQAMPLSPDRISALGEQLDSMTAEEASQILDSVFANPDTGEPRGDP